MTRWSVLLLALGLCALPVHAADPLEAPGISGVTPGAPPAPDAVDPLAREIASGLRCPVCQGLAVSDSSSNAAVQMHDRIRELVAQGYDRDQIEDYFVSKYGEWVLLEPRRSGLNLVVWVGPLLALAVGAGLAVGSVLRRREDDPDTVIDESGTHLPAGDPHMARLLAEVDDD